MSRLLRPASIEDVVDGRKLRVQLTAAALDNLDDPATARAAALKLLHGALFRGRMIAKERLEAGAGGHETSALLATVMDEVIAALFDFTTIHVHRSRNPTQGERFAVVAVGGYGRGQLAPSSDVDLLFLRAYKETPWTESVTEFMLYALWDMGLKVGHASRTIDECLRLAKGDVTIATTLLEVRHIAGDEPQFAELVRRYRNDFVPANIDAFISAKLKERDERHLRAGQSRYMVEPNVKEGKGGLRDLHTLFWIARFLHGFADPVEYARAGIFTPKEIATFIRSSEFLWAVRCHLHFLTGRAEERVTFDVQPEIAERLGFRGRGTNPAVERFMKRYFLVAKDVGALTRIFSAKLEADQRKRAPTGLGRLLPRSTVKRTKIDVPGFAIETERLTIDQADVFEQDPVNLLRVFDLADRRDLDIHPDAMAAITRSARLINPALRANPEAQTLMLGLIESRRKPGAILSLMNEADVLGRFLPEFGHIVARTQFNMYHHYTVDEHTLRAVQIISDIEHGRHAEEHPLASSIFARLINRRALYLAMLLHDTGKGHGDQQIEGAATSLAACRRLGVSEEEAELVSWLVGHHLLMSDVAQRRDISDPRTVAAFAEAVGSVERLRLLVVLTVADIRAVGPGVWNGWKGQLLRDLYRLTEAALRGGHTDEEIVRERLGEQADEARAALTGAVGASQEWIAAFDDAYWLSFEPEAHVWHAREAAASDGALVHVAARPVPSRGVTEVMILAPDRQGLFAHLAAACARAGADVADARIHTTRDGRAFDVFSLMDGEGKAFGAESKPTLQRFLEGLKSAAMQDGPPQPPPRQPVHRRKAAFAIEPWVSIDFEASRDSVLFEASGRDRPGLLAELAAVLARAGFSVVSAHIDAVGERVADNFYVQDHDGARPQPGPRLEAVREALERVFAEHEPDAPQTLARETLARAPASTAR
jgi:[protein-PII] uridylyltransferase